ncbi:MAG: hypothetical protein R3Y64_10465 [Peptostreptococcaceae bacterium]
MAVSVYLMFDKEINPREIKRIDYDIILEDVFEAYVPEVTKVLLIKDWSDRRRKPLFNALKVLNEGSFTHSGKIAEKEEGIERIEVINNSLMIITYEEEIKKFHLAPTNHPNIYTTYINDELIHIIDLSLL